MKFLKLFFQVFMPLAFIFSACQVGKQIEDVSDAGYTVEFVVNEYSASGDKDYFRGIELQFSHDDKPGEIHEVKCGDRFSGTITFENVKEAVGVIASTMFEEAASDSSEFKLGYNADFVVYLKNDKGEVIDVKMIQKSEELETDMFPENEIDYSLFSEAFVFRVSDKGLEPVSPEVPTIQEKKHPLVDDDDVKIDASLYLYGSDTNHDAMVETNEHHLHDNILTRFSSVSNWDGSSVLGRGDFIFLKGVRLEQSVRDNISKSLSSGAILIVDLVDSYQVLQDFCTNLNLYNPLPEGDDITNKMFMFARPNYDNNFYIDGNRYGKLSFILNPKTETGEDGEDGIFLSDYEQGEIVDDAITRISELIRNRQPLHTFSTSKSGVNDITALSSASKAYISVSQGVKASDYKRKNGFSTTSNNYSLEFDIWSAFSISEKRTYYFIHQEFIGNFSNAFVGTYYNAVTTNHCYTIAKINEWYASSVTMTATQNDCKGIKIHRHSPATTERQGSYTSGFSWNLAGDVGVEGNTEGTVSGHFNVSGGISFSESTTYPLHDVTVTNLTDPTGTLRWTYKFAYPSYGFSLFSVAASWIDDGALAGRSTYNAGQDYLISFPESELNPALSAQFKVELRSSAIKCGVERGVWTLPVESKVVNIALPYMCTDNFKK